MEWGPKARACQALTLRPTLNAADGEVTGEKPHKGITNGRANFEINFFFFFANRA